MLDPTGTLKMKSKESSLEADTSSDLLFRQAFTRRSLGFDQANLVDFERHEEWAEKLFTARFREPPQGYCKVSHQQMLNADAQLFVRLAELTRSGTQAVATGRPLDAVWSQAMSDPDVLHLIQPMPTPPPSHKEHRSQPYGPNPRRLKGEGKGKKGGVLPLALKHGVANTKNGKPLCFDYNLGKCTRKVTRGACAKGLHLCCMKDCQKAGHRYLTSPSKPSSPRNERLSAAPCNTSACPAQVPDPAQTANAGSSMPSKRKAFSLEVMPSQLDESHQQVIDVSSPSSLSATSADEELILTPKGRVTAGSSKAADVGPVSFEPQRSQQTSSIRTATSGPSLAEVPSLVASQQEWVSQPISHATPGLSHAETPLTVASQQGRATQLLSQVPLTAPEAEAKSTAKTVGLVVELCAGSAMLSSCFYEQGWEVFPVDHVHNRHHPLAKVCNLDLAEDSTWEYLHTVLNQHKIAYVHVAPPCGACSRTDWTDRQPSCGLSWISTCPALRLVRLANVLPPLSLRRVLRRRQSQRRPQSDGGSTPASSSSYRKRSGAQYSQDLLAEASTQLEPLSGLDLFERIWVLPEGRDLPRLMQAFRERFGVRFGRCLELLQDASPAGPSCGLLCPPTFRAPGPRQQLPPTPERVILVIGHEWRRGSVCCLVRIFPAPFRWPYSLLSPLVLSAS